MSKLVKKLQQMENSSPSLGFKSVRVQRGRQMLLIACLPDKDGSPPPGLTGIDVDALVFKVKEVDGLTDASKMAGAAGDLPWGIWTGTIAEEQVQRIKEMQADFLIFEATGTPIGLLQDEDLGKILQLDLTQPEGLLSAVDELPIDMALVEMDKEKKSLTVDDLIKYHWVSDLLSKPLLAYSKREATEAELRSLWEAGVKGLIVEVPAKSGPKILSRISEIMLGLPAKPKKNAGKASLLPRVEVGQEEDDEED